MVTDSLVIEAKLGEEAFLVHEVLFSGVLRIVRAIPAVEFFLQLHYHIAVGTLT